MLPPGKLKLAPFTIVMLTLTLSACDGPLGPLAGGALSGEVVNESVTDWTFANEVETIQLETRPAEPYSVNTWIGVDQGNLYIPTSLILGEEDPAQRAWVQHVAADPRVRLRIEGRLYPATLERVNDENLIARVKVAMLTKYKAEQSEHSDRAWMFQVRTREIAGSSQ